MQKDVPTLYANNDRNIGFNMSIYSDIAYTRPKVRKKKRSDVTRP